MKIIIIDDNKEFRLSLEHLIVQKLNYRLLGSFESGEAFLAVSTQYNPDIVLMDISMPGTDGYETTKKLIWRNPNLKIIAITMFTDKAYLKKLIENGFKGCVYKTNIYKELGKAITTVQNNNYYFPGDINF